MDQFTAGSDFIVAPVLAPRTSKVNVYLPRGTGKFIITIIIHDFEFDIYLCNLNY